MQRIALSHGTARVADDVSQSTVKLLNHISKVAFTFDTKRIEELNVLKDSLTTLTEFESGEDTQLNVIADQESVIKHYVSTACNKYCLNSELLLNITKRTRKDEYAWIRFALYAVLRDAHKYTQIQIGLVFNTDRTSVINGLKQIDYALAHSTHNHKPDIRNAIKLYHELMIKN